MSSASKNLTPLQAIGVLVVLGGGGFLYFAERKPARTLQDIHNQVADQAVAQYEMAKRQGDPMQVCVQAGFVAAAWLQAQNQAQYDAAKATQRVDCARATVPRP